jgi:ribonuclease R
MLDNKTLSQLQQLKQQLEDSKEYAEGIVKGTQRKFGFVVLDDGREIYLDPDEMQKVFPGDRVQILIFNEQQGKEKPKAKAKLEKLLSSPLTEFTGRYIVKGQGHFVEPDLPRLTRWIFIPPAARKGASAGDYIRCVINRHPYPSAKPQAKVLEVIGAPDYIGIEADYVISKFQLDPAWPKNWQDTLLDIDFGQRQDLTQVPFITIDSASTLDMDDALFAQTTDQGWQLQVAIADPCAYIPADSELDLLIRRRGTSTYLPRRPVPMLPELLANSLCSLLAQQLRPALVCTMNITDTGVISDYAITEARICSQAKLNYNSVSALLDDTEADESAECHAHKNTLFALKSVCDLLRTHRQQHHLVTEGRPDYRLILNPQCKLERIELQQKNSAQLLVEEAMITANRCAADMLGTEGIFISHAGFRSERLPDVRKLAEEQLSMCDIDFSTPAGYRTLMNGIDDQAIKFPLRAVLSRLLERSRLSATVQPHHGMGLAAYTTFTSPIRKYNDFLVHRIIKAQLNQQPLPRIDQSSLDELQQIQDRSRQATQQMEQWLKCQFMQPLIGQHFCGQVSQINSNGFTVRLNASYIEGMVETRLLTEKYSFDPMRMRLSSKTQTIELNQNIDVVVKEVDCNQRIIRYDLLASQSSTAVVQPAA